MEQLIEYIEELAAMRRKCLLRFKNELGAIIILDTRIVDFYEEENIRYILTEEDIRINTTAIIDIDNIISSSIG